TLHADGCGRHLHRRSDKDSANPGSDAETISGSRICFWQGRPIRNGHRSRTALDGGNGREVKTPGAMAAGHDVGKTPRGDERKTRDARDGEYFLDADSNADRNAHDRLSVSSRNQSFRF